MRLHILLVDDSVTIRRYARSILEGLEENYRITEREDGAAALGWLSSLVPSEFPDLIIIDRNMPKMTGDESVRIIKMDEEWRSIPVLFLTAQAEGAQVGDEGLLLSADAYVCKPFEPEELTAVVRRLMPINNAESMRTLPEEEKSVADSVLPEVEVKDNDSMLDLFLVEVSEHAATMVQGVGDLHSGGAVSDTVAELIRSAHSIKGAGGIVGLSGFAGLAGALEVYFSRLKTSGGLIEREQALVLDQSVDAFVTLGNAFSHQVRSMELECLPELQSLEARLQEFLGDSSSAQGASDSSFSPPTEVSQSAPVEIQEVIVEGHLDSTGAMNSGGGTGQAVHVTPDANTDHRIVVLLIDDQRIIGESLRQMLQNESDIQFHFCQDPMKAIEIALEIRPTVILQDLVMPELDGLELVRRFRAQQDLDKVPLIVLSGTEVAEVKAEAFALGANDYMVKLPNALEVIARIRYHSQGYINLLEREAAMARVTWLAEHDPLTACLNRRTWHEGLDDAIVTLALDEALVLAICDIDFFKKVNDTYGHPCGDYGIQHVVAILEKGIGGLGQLGRLGGEEFGIFMVLSKITPEAGDPVTEADKIFEHIRKELEDSPLSWNEHVLTLTMSFGITFHRAGENGESALSRADAGVYQAKDGGRNQVARM